VNRLLTENRTNLSTNAAIFGITYTYDKNGNRKTLRGTGTHQQPAATVDYTYAANSNRLATISRDGVVTSPAHLTEGELRLDFVSGYDSHGQRRWSGMRNGDTTQPEYYFAYNHKRERTVRSIRNNGASWSANAIQYVYDEESHLIGEYKSNGTPIVEYVWTGDVPVAAIYGTTSATKIYYIVTDAQNTPRRLIDSSNNAVVWAWDSTAFGVAPPSIETVKFNLRFPGQYYDEITKQHYNLNRYYNPEIGRYMEADPIGLEGGLNPYAYAGSNPVMNTDSTGLLVELRERSVNGTYKIGGHTYWYIQPDNRAELKQYSGFPAPSSFTLGAYNVGGMLQPSISAESDFTAIPRQSYKIDPPSQYQSGSVSADTQFITALINGYSNYQQNTRSQGLSYQATAGEIKSFPSMFGQMPSNGIAYNSNSWAYGLGNSVGVNMNKIDPWMYQPGISNPVPNSYFQQYNQSNGLNIQLDLNSALRW